LNSGRVFSAAAFRAGFRLHPMARLNRTPARAANALRRGLSRRIAGIAAKFKRDAA
jgi:hypothetical protein